MLIAEEFLLLCLDEESGRRLAGSDKVDPALSAALLAELALAERISVTGDDEGWSRRRRLQVVSLTPTDDPELDRALQAVVESEGRRLGDLVSPMSRRRLSKGLRDRLLERLVAAGVLDRQQGTVFGLIPQTSWPTRDRRAEDEVRRRLHSALVAGETPSERTVTLVALLQATGLVTKVLDVTDRKALRQKAKELSEGDWAARAVKQAIDEATAAITAASAGGADGS